MEQDAMQNILTKPAVFAGLLFFMAVASATYYFTADTVDSTSAPIAENNVEAENIEPILITETEVKKNFDKEEKNPYEVAEAALDGGKPGERLRSVLMLRGQFTKEAVRLLTQFLNDQDISIVEEAMDALAYIGVNGGLQAEVFAVLKEKAQDPTFNRRGTALVTASIVMKAEAELVLNLIDGFIAPDEEHMNLFAARALNYIEDPKALPLVEKLLSMSRDNDVARNCFHMAARLNTPEAAALLAAYVNSNDPYLQKHAVHALGLNTSPVYQQMLADAIASGAMRHDSIGYLAVTESAADVFGNAMTNPKMSKKDKLSLLKDIGENTTKSPKEESRTDIFNKAVKPLLLSNDPDLVKAAMEASSDMRADRDEVIDNTVKALDESNDAELYKIAMGVLEEYMVPRKADAFEPMYYHEDEYVRRMAFFLSEGFLDAESDAHFNMVKELNAATEDDVLKASTETTLKNKFKDKYNGS
jgi:HEAT repeat protein